MIVQDIITRVRQIVSETDSSNSHASDSVILGWINACTLQLCSTINTLPKSKSITTTCAETITLDKSYLRLDYVSVADASTPPVHKILTTIDFSNFARTSAGWEDQPAGEPSMLVRMTNLDWLVWPKPSAVWTGKAMTLIGSVLPADLTTTSAEPPVSIALHPAYPHYCAWLFFLLLNNPERAASEFSVFDGLRKMNTQTATSTTGSQQKFSIRGV